jgi:hypothetical protein
MTGAYTALPPVYTVPPTYPGVPFNWPQTWVFPGPPFAPGYDPSVSLSPSGPTAISPESSSVIVSKLVDRQGNDELGYSEYVASKDFDDDEGQYWLADLNGVPIQMKPQGGSFADMLTVPWSQSGSFWQSVETIEFDTDRNDFGKTITMTFISQSADEEETLDILVKPVKIYGYIYAGNGVGKPGATATFTATATSEVQIGIADGSGYYYVEFTEEDDASGYDVVVAASGETDKDYTVDSKGSIGDYQEDFWFGDPSMTISTDMFFTTTDSEKYRYKLSGSSSGQLEITWETGVGFTVNSSGALASIFGSTSGYTLSLGQGHIWFDGSANTAEMAILEGDTFQVEVEGVRDQQNPLPGNILLSWDWLWRTYRGVTQYLTAEVSGDYSTWIEPQGTFTNTYTIGTITDGIISE